MTPDMYSVRFVGENDLPPAQPWAIAWERDRHCYLFIKRSAVYPVVLEETWAAFAQFARHMRDDVA